MEDLVADSEAKALRTARFFVGDKEDEEWCNSIACCSLGNVISKKSYFNENETFFYD